jgi:hypothetical protein
MSGLLGAFALTFSLDVDVPPSKVRDWTIRSVTGDGAPVERRGTFLLLEEGPDRFASRYTEGSVRQLRVIEWTNTDHGEGAVVHSVGTTPRLSARYSVDVVPSRSGSRLKVRYVLETPMAGLALSFRFSRRRTLARRLASAWLPMEETRRWARWTIEPNGGPSAEVGAG